jgi:hypothetical protein
MATQIIVPDLEGIHNRDPLASAARLRKSGTYKDLSTVIVCPTRGMIPATVVQSWMGMMRPMNQRVIGPIFIQEMEVGEAYCAALDLILSNPGFESYQFMLTVEEDNCPPPDGLMKLYEAIEGQVDGRKYDCVGGLYWTKGEGGQPMIYGDPNVYPKSFLPQIPEPEIVQPANGLGMGFNLWRLSMFREGKIEKPFFKTLQQVNPGQGVQAYTQDLYFFEKAGRYGYTFACDTRVRVGHFDAQSSIMW